MTALCGGGTSGVKLGTAAVVDYTSGLLAVLMAEFGAAWLIPAIPIAGLVPLVLSSFCSSDPPAIVAMTQAESDALLKLNLGADFDSGLPKLVALLQNIIWNDACNCTSGAYTPAVAPAQPANSITPVALPVSPQRQSTCGIIGVQTQSAVVAGGNNFGSFNFSTFPKLAFFRVHFSRLRIGAGPHTDSTLSIFWGAPGPTFLQNIATCPSDSIERTVDIPLLAGYTAVNQIGLSASANSTDTYNAWAEMFCGPPGASSQGCCPPDPTLLATVQQLMKLVTDMQRSYAPFGYLVSTAHAGLTGTGSVPVSRLIGAKVAITAFPAGNVQLPGNPAYVKDLGWISVSETDGMIQERRVSQLGFTWFPSDMVLATNINYALAPGVTATITELAPER